MKKMTLDGLKKILAGLKHEVKVQEETQQLYFIFKDDKREFPVFLRILTEGVLLQVLAFLPCSVKPETAADVARLLHLLNKELDMPGFGMDEAAGVAFYRCVIPTPKQELDQTILESYLNTIQLVCKTFSPSVEAVAFGAATFDQILQKAKELNANK